MDNIFKHFKDIRYLTYKKNGGSKIGLPELDVDLDIEGNILTVKVSTLLHSNVYNVPLKLSYTNVVPIWSDGIVFIVKATNSEMNYASELTINITDPYSESIDINENITKRS